MRLRALFATSLVVACSTYGANDAPSSTSDDAGSDASSPADASSSDTSSDAAPGPFCANRMPAPFFCVDFDDGKPAGFGFNDTTGDFALDTSTSTSAPASLRVRVSADGGNESYVARRFDGTSLLSRIAVSVRFRWDADDGIPIRIDTAESDCNVDLVKSGDGWELQGIGHVDGEAVLAVKALPYYPVRGEWTKIDLTLVKTSPNAFVDLSMYVDGMAAVTDMQTACSALGLKKLQLGLQYSDPGEVHFDDVLVEGE